MSTTSAYGWNIPDNTDLVKDGALAIRTLGNAIDTSMNTALGTKKAGMVLLNTTSFSAVSSVSLPANTFTSTYKDYQIIYSAVLTNATQIVLRLRASGSDDTNSNYSNALYRYDSLNTAAGEDARASSSFWGFQNANATFNNDFDMTLYSPQATALTRYSGTGFLQTSASGMKALFGAGHYNGTTSFDSLSLFVTAGTFTGTIKAFGINQ